MLILPAKVPLVASLAQAAVSFDGSSQYLTRGADLTGSADGKQGTVSFWCYHTSTGSDDYILGNDRFRVGFEPGTLRIYGKNASGTDIIDIGTNNVITLNAWRHCIATWNLGTGARYIYIQGSSDITAFSFTNDDIDYTRSDFAIAASPAGANHYVGYLAELWFHPIFVDISDFATRSKFITSGNKPENLGNTGEVPLGYSPLIYMAGEASTWATNKGTGGGFTVNGTALSAAPSTPWD